MPTVLDNLRQAYENLTAKYAEATANPKPSYSIDGQSVSHESFLRSLLDQIEKLREQLRANGDPEFGPYELRSRGTT